MSLQPTLEPVCTESTADSTIDVVVDARARELGGVAIRRVLPSARRRMVGPFTFLDQMGETTLGPGGGIDVPPHPHIGLATVTYLFEGEIEHRDSLGSLQPIRPGDLNWMIAGRGIVHSERTPESARAAGSRLHGLQIWVALPREHEECEPAFDHHPGATIPEIVLGAARLRVLAGSAYGETAPPRTLSPLFYVDVALAAGGELELTDEYEERAVYVVRGTVSAGGERAEPGRLIAFTKAAKVVLRADVETRLVLLGGAPLDGPRFIEWNFVSSSKEQIARAKDDWKARRFPRVPGDDGYVPFPD